MKRMLSVLRPLEYLIKTDDKNRYAASFLKTAKKSARDLNGARPEDLNQALYLLGNVAHDVSLMKTSSLYARAKGVSRQDAAKDLSAKNARRFYETAQTIVTQCPADNILDWKAYHAVCKEAPPVSHLWRDAPQAFSMYQNGYLTAVTALNAPGVKASPHEANGHYIGAVDPDDEAPIVPVAQRRQDGSLYFFYGEFHGSKQWMTQNLNMRPEFFSEGVKERDTKKRFFAFADEATHFLNLQQKYRGRYDIVLS